jgi:hypothetical protein
MLLRSSILAGVAAIALVGFAQAASQPAPADMPSAQATTPPSTPSTAPSTPSTAPATDTAAPAPAQGIKLSEVQNPKATLRGAAVKDSKGDAIGEVKSVQIGSDGKVAAVNVTVGTKTVALKPDTLSYMQAENTLVSTQSKSEITTH